jgi:RimJ/RimL family protein N-acetyltransferase
LTTAIATERLLLRHWLETDREPFATMNADPRVMRYFPATLSAGESDALLERIKTGHANHGFGLWAVEVPGVAPFIGFTGLAVPRFEAHFTPCVEIGWRLAAEYWNRGYATEGARAVLSLAFGTLDLDEVVSFTAVGNLPSRRVMEKIGMKHDDGDDFEHPGLSEGHRLRPHVLYRLPRGVWKAAAGRKRSDAQ